MSISSREGLVASGLTRRDLLKSAAFTTAALLAPSLEAQGPVSLARNSPARQKLTDWELHQGQIGGPWEIWRIKAQAPLPWQKVQLPHCFNARDAVDPDQPYYEGPAWYRTKFQLANPYPQGRTLLHFEGAGQRSEIFVYLSRVGEHTGGYDEFVVDLTEAVSRHPFLHNEVPLAVLCDNSRDLETIPSDLNDFPRYGGLYRPVSLIYLPAISLERVHIDANLVSTASAAISIRARLYNPTRQNEDVQLSVEIFDPAGTPLKQYQQKVACWDGEREIAAIQLSSPKLWSPSNPALYRCEVSLVSSGGTTTAIERFGCRYYEFVDHGPFKLNGERLLLRGTHREEDHALVGAAMTDEMTSQELRMVKDMGANFLRLAHHQQSETVLRLCDELGLLVWEEVPWSRGGLGDESYKQEVRNMLAAMIDQHYNHPSVILWGLGNELDWPGDFPEFDQRAIRGFVQELNANAHRLDPFRKTALRRCDFSSDIPDVYSPSNWAGWYAEPYTKYRETLSAQARRVKHMLLMEWGGESHAGRHSEDPERAILKYLHEQFANAKERELLLNCGQTDPSGKGDWSETYICYLFDWILKEQETMPWFAGSAQWIFKDFATPLRANNPIPHVNEKGLVERNLTLKEGYFVFQSYWADKPMIHIYGHSWPIRWGDEQEPKLVRVYSNCEHAELFLNNTSFGTKVRNSQDFPAAGLRWIVKFRTGENHLRVVGHKNGAVVKDEVQFQYQTQKWGQPARLELQEIGRSNDVVSVEGRVLDASGRLCLDARTRISFGLAGDGTLLDNTGTVTGSRVVEAQNGRARISFATDGGKSVVSASAAGLSTTFLAPTTSRI